MRLRPNLRRRTLAFAAIIVLALTAVAAVPSEAQTYTVLHSFGSGADGEVPVGGIRPRLPKTGFYGTTYRGGASGDGTMFYTVGPDWVETIVFSFDGANGRGPESRPSGGGYGTALAGGEYGFGAVYNSSGDAIYSFCPAAPSCIEGPARSETSPSCNLHSTTTYSTGPQEQGVHMGRAPCSCRI
jgi:hypothetical protein